MNIYSRVSCLGGTIVFICYTPHLPVLNKSSPPLTWLEDNAYEYTVKLACEDAHSPIDDDLAIT